MLRLVVLRVINAILPEERSMRIAYLFSTRGWRMKKILLAALNPAPVHYLYFVAKGNGTHYFSPDLSEHNRVVRLFQKRGS